MVCNLQKGAGRLGTWKGIAYIKPRVFILRYRIRVPACLFIIWKKFTLYALISSCTGWLQLFGTLIFINLFRMTWTTKMLDSSHESAGIEDSKMVQHFTENLKLSCVDNFLWLQKNLKFMKLEIQIHGYFKKILSGKNDQPFQMF